MKTGAQLTSAIAALAMAMALGLPARASEPDLDRFKSEIDAFVGRLEPDTNGVVKWAGADPYEIRREGDGLVAVITNARLFLQTQEIDRLALDRVEIRQIGHKEGGRLIELAILLPKEVRLDEADGTETRLILEDGRANAVIEAQSGRGRETAIALAGARIDQPKSGAWISFGPLAMTSKLIAEPDGGWSGPVDFELKEVEFFFPQGPAGGVIQRIAFTGRSSGPELQRLEKLRETLDALQTDDAGLPEARLARFWAMLPTIPAAFGTIRGDAAIEGLTVRGATGDRLVSLAKAEMGTEATGLDSDTAAVRFGIRQDGLDLSPSLLDAAAVPHRVVIDLGFGNLSVEALRNLLRAAGAVREGDGAREQEKQQATQQMLGAMAMLNPVFHIYDIAVDTRDVGADLTAEVRGSPLVPKGYFAEGDLVVRGFDAIPHLSADIPFAEYLPVLQELGIEDKAPDGTPRVKFHLASAPPKWIAVNGNDVGAWFEASEPEPGRPRLLKPTDPPMHGNDVEGVQRALAAADIAAGQDGVYRPSTAAAVARFQKRNRLNESGVVDAETRRQLGVTAETPRPGGRN